MPLGVQTVSNQERHVQAIPLSLYRQKPLLAVQRRLTTRLCPPHVGQQATTGCGGTIGGGLQAMGCACTIIRRRVAACMGQLACRKPK